MKKIKDIIQMALPSSKIKNDIQIKYNQCGTLRPINISELSLTISMKKKVLDIRQQHDKINIIRDNQKLTLIIPYRNREEHLKEFLPALQNRLNEQNIDYEILIAEQDDINLFNKAKLMNLAVTQARQDSTYFVFHDVDSMPTNIDYRYCNHSLKLFNHIKRYEKYYEEYQQTIFGGAILVPKDIFLNINGFSNNYWQWGKEDDDFLFRHLFKGFNPLYDAEGKLRMLPHPLSVTLDVNGNITNDTKVLQQNKKLSDKNKKTFSKFKRGLLNQDDDGINSLSDYTISSISTQNRIKTIKIKFEKSL